MGIFGKNIRSYPTVHPSPAYSAQSMGGKLKFLNFLQPDFMFINGIKESAQKNGRK